MSESPDAIGLIETDTFCPSCHYNLHGQVVRLDERLNIPVVRCSECGAYSPAGHTVTARQPWLNRLAAAALTWWIVFVVAVISFNIMTMIPWHILARETIVLNEWEMPPLDELPTTTPINSFDQNVELQRRLRPLSSVISFDPEFVLAAGVALLHGFLLGVFCGCVTWFWRPAASRFVFALIPLIAGGIWIVVDGNQSYTDDVPGVVVSTMLLTTLPLMFAVVAGVVLSLPIGRLAVQLLLPKNVRPLFGFLWTDAGKPLPWGRTREKPITPAT
jgi:hypothetical protein